MVADWPRNGSHPPSADPSLERCNHALGDPHAAVCTNPRRVLPRAPYSARSPFSPAGAWEIVGRISTIDLDDGAIAGGRLVDLSVALNWYLNPVARVSLNYVHARPEDAGAASIFLLRLQLNPY